MFTGPMFRRMFRRNAKKHTPISRPLSRWNRYRLNLELLEDRRVPATIVVNVSGDSTTPFGDGNYSL